VLAVTLIATWLAAAAEGAAPAEAPAVAADIDDVEPERDEQVGYWTFAGVPKLTFNSDDGFGFGARVVAYWHRFHTKPYKTSLTAQAWITTNFVQHHYVKVDAIDAWNVPLRLDAEAGYFHSLTQNYCGLGDDVVCTSDTRTRLRFFSPYVLANARYRVVDGIGGQHIKVEPFVGYRGSGYVHGTWGDLTPYPGSVYEDAFPRGETGFASVMQAGLFIDTRDREPTPTHGFALEASARGASPITGSSWSFSGLNATARLFSPVAPQLFGRGRVTFAQRIVTDVMLGDPPTLELARVGGTTDYFAFGGQDMGRGIRVQRYLGKVKAMIQEELRVDAIHVHPWGNDLGILVAPFFDAGIVMEDERALVRAVQDGGPRLLWGGGLAFRVLWNDAFVMRLDLAMSPIEGLRVGAYTAPGHPY
jgi:Omp85 superfamily domain